MVIVTSVITSIVVSFLTYLFTKKFDNREKYKTQSLLGVELLNVLIEEITTGYEIITAPLGKVLYNPPPKPISNRCWNGISTFSDEILLRIIAVSKGINDERFPIKEIRIHIKNYYEKTLIEWEEMVKTSWEICQIKDNCEEVNTIKHNCGIFAKEVLDLLCQVRDLLEVNAKRTFPK